MWMTWDRRTGRERRKRRRGGGVIPFLFFFFHRKTEPLESNTRETGSNRTRRRTLTPQGGAMERERAVRDTGRWSERWMEREREKVERG